MKLAMIGVVGLSPQVVTEAVYALAGEGRQVDEIHLITTRSGRDEIMKQLLAPGDGRLAALCREYNLRLPDCGPHTLRVVRGNDVEIDDIITQDDNENLLALCLDTAWQHTGRDDCAVAFLVAGGRKTMTSCLTLAAQLYGRPCDRIYHVLVSPEFESCRDFWYPPRRSVPVELHDRRGNPYRKESRYASVRLVPVPFVSLRDRLDKTLLEKPRCPAELIASLVRDKGKKLIVDVAENRIVYGNQECDLNPAHMALYAWFVRNKKECAEAESGSCRGCVTCYCDVVDVLEAGRAIRAFYRRVPGSRLVEEMSDTGIAGLTAENFRSYRARINGRLREAFGTAAAEQLAISSVGNRPTTRYGIKIDSDRIRLVM